jgi:hypothetical protein
VCIEHIYNPHGTSCGVLKWAAANIGNPRG